MDQRRRSIKWFLATDKPSIRDDYRRLLGDDLLVWEGTISKTSVEGMQDALAEMWMLGEADEVIISPYSTFGCWLSSCLFFFFGGR